MEEEEDEDEKAVLEKVFGPSSSSSSSESEGKEEDEKKEEDATSTWEWEAVEQVKGLWLCRKFLSDEEQSVLLSAIEAQEWFSQPNTNQAMRFGDLPPWALQLSNTIRRSLLQPSTTTFSPLPLHLLSREPLFDQMIANLYHPGDGICAHVDLMRFQDGIAIVSLESSCVMHFTHVDEHHGSAPVPVLLTPGSLVVMSGQARYNWKHEINRRPGFQVWEGKELHQSRRISITLRKLCPDP